MTASRFTPAGAVDLGPAWAGNSVNCVPFRHAALLRRGNRDLLSFFDPAGRVVVTEVRGCTVLGRQDLAGVVKPDDAHQAVSMGFDPRGRIHLAWGAHNSVLQTAVSRTSRLADGFATATLADPSGITYPMFIRTADELLLVYRRGPHFRGELVACRQGRSADAWTPDPEPFLSGLAGPRPCGPYINTPVVAGDGRLTLFVVWRLPSDATSAGAVVNAGIDCMASSDGLRTLETYGGVAIRGPVVPAYAERVIPIPLGSSLINQASAAAMPDGRPAVLTFWDAGDGAPQYRLGWPEADAAGRVAWRVSTLSRFTTRFGLDGRGTLPLPHSRPTLLFEADGAALVIFRSVEHGNRLMVSVHRAPDYAVTDEPLVLLDQDLDQYEPIVSRAAWQTDRSLVLFVQRCAQGVGRDGKPDRAEAPGRLLRWLPG